MLYYLLHVHHWPLSELRSLYEAQDAWQEIIWTFAAYEAEKRAETARR